MTKKHVTIFFLLPLFYLCGGNIPEMHYYLIDYPVIPAANKSAPVYPITLGVERFQAMPLYEEERLVYRDSPYEGKYYHYHRWITSPEVMITDKVTEQLAASNLFQQVISFPKFSQVDYVLHGTIKALEEWDEGNQWYARVQIAFELVDQKTRQIIWQRTIEEKNLVTQKIPAEIVKGINLGVQQCIVEVQKQFNIIFQKR